MNDKLNTYRVHKVSIPLIPQLVNHLLPEASTCTWESNDVAWCMHYRDFLNSHSSIVAAVEDEDSYSSSHRLRGVSEIKFLNAQSIAPIGIHRQLCQIYGHTQFDGRHISFRSSAGRCLTLLLPRGVIEIPQW